MIQVELSPTQTTILAAACRRDDRLVFPVTAKLQGGAVGNVLKSLLNKRLIEEIPATDDMTVWRTGGDGTPLTLRATPAACEALGIDADTGAGTATKEEPAADMAGEADTAPKPRKTREGGKQDVVIAMLRRPEGASVAEIMAATEWLGHTVRGFIAGTAKKKLGLAVTSEKHETRGRTYKLPAA